MALPSSRSRLSSRTVWMVGSNLLLLVAAVALVIRAWVVVSWSLLALLLALALAPVLVRMERHMPRAVAVLAMVGAVAAVALVSFVWLVPQLVEQGRRLVEHLPELAARLREQPSFQWVESNVLGTNVVSQMERAGPRLAEPFFLVVRDVLHAGVAAVTIATLTVFMLLSGPSVVESLLGWVHPQERPRCRRLAGDIVQKIGGYVAGTLLVVALNGTVVTVLLFALGVPYALPLGFLCALLSLIPYAGSTLFMLLEAGIVMALRGPHLALLAVGGTFVYFFFKDRLIDPLVMRHTTKINPLLSTEVILLGSAVAGVKGAVLALPVTAALQVLLNEAKGRRQARWAEAVGGAPPAPGDGPGAPVESSRLEAEEQPVRH